MHPLSLFIFSAFLGSLSIIFVPYVEASKKGFSIDLIHRDSASSPFYNPSMTQSEQIRGASLRSVSRFSRVVQLSSNGTNQSPESIIVANGDVGDYLTRIYIGTPPVERFVVADTGSDLVWVQCSPCEGSNCFAQDTPLFDPSNSSTFTSLTCDSRNCSLLSQNQHTCGNSNECIYAYSYGDNSFTNGELAIDSINFANSTANDQSGVTSFPSSIFGCGYNNSVTFNSTKKATGLAGLGAGPLSLVSQLGDEIGHKFSYCLVPINSTFNSKLNFGDQATILSNNSVATPLITKPSNPTFYYLNLEGISVDQNMVQTNQTGGNIVIDSGTTLTTLEPSFYNEFLALVKKAFGVDGVKNPPKPYEFCINYDGGNINVPNFEFHFTGASITLNPNYLFGAVEDNLLCLLIVSNTDTIDISIFGNLAQIDFQVEYDLKVKQVSFAPTDCTQNN